MGMDDSVVSANTVHVRCGSDIRRALQQAGIGGRFVEFSDPVCQGPVPAGLDDAGLAAVRAHFIAEAYGGGEVGCRRRLEGEMAALDALDDGDSPLLWFEHDSYDQAILIRLLDRLGRRPALRARARLICIEDFPGVDRFIGLGQLSPPQLASLLPRAAPVSDAQVALATAAWQAFRDAAPGALWDLASVGTPALPPLAAALRRHLMDLPGRRDGLSLTERLCLRAVAEGEAQPGRVFAALNDRLDPLPFLGDMMLWPILRRLCDAREPALMPFAAWNDALGLTAFGVALLNGEADWCAANGCDRWLGGIDLRGDRPAWRWDETADRPLAA